MKRISAHEGAAPGWSRPKLEVRDLELVLALAAAGTTARAASSLLITQSAVSRALTLAEARVGARLFERSPRGLAPTAAGERLIARAGMFLTQLCELERLVRAPEAAPTRVRLVCECYTAYRWLPSAMAQLRVRSPQLQVDILTEHTADPVRALLREQIDVALLTTALVPRHGALLEQELFSDEVVFVVAASHPLAQHRFITPEDLQAHSLITSNTPSAEARWFMARVFGRRKPRLELVRFPLTEAIMDAARAGMGIAVLSEWVASGYLESGDLVVKRLRTGALRRSWRMAYRREMAEAAERLLGPLTSSAPRLHALGSR